ncbi:glycine zipper 2TM domain-containing protein [Hydrogenophilus thiooxidans]|uniref:glycine zipper 2TM domain-containing protein n=1 Tax=Hydrogenophilus thiooxidans TaxID=2820326 RepID=UPI002016CD10|nr:glycine zipper 2TM domain-containing protein [Hydrogenophilus thiooxidans]
MDKRFWTAFVGLVGGALLVSGCASSLGGGAYARSEARRVMEVQYGVIEAIRPVRLEGTETGAGPLTGALLGGLAGNTLGGGRGRIATTAVGAVAGAVAGQAVEGAVTARPGVEITVRLDNGRVLAVTQEDEGEGFRVGERVRLLTDRYGNARVAR